MSIFNSPRLRERQEGFDLVSAISNDKLRCFIIHYSCESFVTNHGKTPRVTSISLRNLKTAQTKSFSIHLQAQIIGLDFNNLTETEYDKLEKEMLNEFSTFVKINNGHKWIHWNMRDSNYGFEAINNRIKILGGQIFEITDDYKYDFPRILSLIYTNGYENNKLKGKLLNLAERNNVTALQAITGEEEARAFDQKDYLKLHLSTLRKVDIIAAILNRVENRDLKVKTDLRTIYGLTLPGIAALVKETPWLAILAGILGYILGDVLHPLFQHFLGTSKW